CARFLYDGYYGWAYW
nr:immunoglobulin heavy chain junction region [Mus musculus]